MMNPAMPTSSAPLNNAARASARRRPNVRWAVAGRCARRMATSEMVMATTVESSCAASASKERLPVKTATKISAKK